jgi:hypothetical protein
MPSEIASSSSERRMRRYGFIGANKSKSAPGIVSIEPDLEVPVTELADQRVCRFELQLSTYIILSCS